ncbi:MAG: GH3 auxin-responsive promoter family protein [Xenococcaceae cyanobacterium MO_188.B29]|nr:GH3 auxin-responsive promoter family protein [Xenococcaceae cyanobacterium MO_188.B29]
MKNTNIIDSIIDNYLRFLFNFLAQRAFNSINKDTQNPNLVQKQVFKKILKLQENTIYGKKYNFSSIKSVADFKNKHPLTNYENYRSIIEQIAETGNYNQLVAEPITLFQETSGTTGKSKLIPRTKTLFSTFQKSFQACRIIAQNHCQPNKIDKKNYRGLPLSNALPLKSTPSGIPRGTGTSGGLRQSKIVQKIIGLNFSSPPSVLLIPDYQSAYYCHLLFALFANQQISYISTNFASNVLEAMQLLEEQWQQLLEDIEHGQICQNLNLDSSLRNELESILEPNPVLAQKLRIEFEKGFENIVPRIWPQLSYVGCITTGSMELYKEKLKFYFGDVALYSHGYGASESWVGVNLRPERETPAYVITSHAAFFEFIPVEEIDLAAPSTVDLSSLEIGKNYEVVVTTVAGLYRYRLGDIVKCVDYYNQSPMVEFLYRRGSLLNLVGEKVSENEIFAALTETLKNLSNESQIVDYTTRIDLSSSPLRYVLYIELSEEFAVLPDLKRYQNQIDDILSSLNVLYLNFRESKSIEKPQIKIVKQNTFKSLKQKILSRGSSESQFKMPRLLKEQILIDYLESLVRAG